MYRPCAEEGKSNMAGSKHTDSQFRQPDKKPLFYRYIVVIDQFPFHVINADVFPVLRPDDQMKSAPTKKKRLLSFFFYFFLRHFQKEEIFFTKSVVILL